ncbi:hypothetical protein [Moritella dasanensis]|uniref:hypothetical protein n=1 Tax=Moritella dasanensis TaxID=428031 RepID=UPI00030F3212|nr:hypothetical protein [Moritella dasanensis]
MNKYKKKTLTRREIKRLEASKRFKDALTRLLDSQKFGSPLTTEVVPPPYKINYLTVEREAGFSTGALRNYPEIKQLIDYECNPDRDFDKPDKANEYAELKFAKQEILDLKKRLVLEKQKIKSIELSLRNSHIQNNELLMALDKVLTPQQRQKIYADKVTGLFGVKHNF